MRGSACSLRVRSADYSGGSGGLAELASSSQRVPAVKPSLLVRRGRSTTQEIAHVILLQAGDPNCARLLGNITRGQESLRPCAGKETDVVFFRG